MNIGEKFILLRQSKNISIYKLSKMSDISENYIRTIEKGRSQPSIQVAERLLISLGTTIPEFFNDSEEVIYPNDFEKELIQSVRMLSEEKAQSILHIAKLLNQ
ncbi:MAG: helix-turn-helix transcriptional regulator [Eubacteriales bacterium]